MQTQTKKQELDPTVKGILELLGEFTEKEPEMDPEKRAAIIERENADPEIRARKEKKINALLDQWEQWGLVKFTDEGEQV